MKSIAEITKNMTDWQPPVIPENIAHGDMPGDKDVYKRQPVG